MSARHSRWSDEPRRDSAGQPIAVRFGESDLEICKLLAPSTNCRAPWSYQYLPSTYFPAILQRGGALKRRLDWLTDEPNWYIQRPVQPRNLSRELIYALHKRGADELREAGIEVPKYRLRPIPHELMACLCAASFEIGARVHDLPITTHEWPVGNLRPDWLPFQIGPTLVLLEADTGSETLYSKEDATTISGKFEQYLQLLTDGMLRRTFRTKDILVLFVTTRETRRDSMVEVLKKVIDGLGLAHEYAAHFGFSAIKYDRFLNTIPKPSDWIVRSPHLRAGFDPMSFVAKTVHNSNGERR